MYRTAYLRQSHLLYLHTRVIEYVFFFFCSNEQMVFACIILTCVVILANMFLMLSTLLENLEGKALVATAIGLTFGGAGYLLALTYVLCISFHMCLSKWLYNPMFILVMHLYYSYLVWRPVRATRAHANMSYAELIQDDEVCFMNRHSLCCGCMNMA